MKKFPLLLFCLAFVGLISGSFALTQNWHSYDGNVNGTGRAASDWYGYKFIAINNVVLSSIELFPNAGTNPTDVNLMDSSCNIIDTNSNITDGNAFLGYALTAGETYYIAVGKPSGQWDLNYNSGAFYPKINTDINWNLGMDLSNGLCNTQSGNTALAIKYIYTELSTSFSYTPLNPTLDFDEGLNSVDVNFLNTNPIVADSFKWDINGVQVAVTKDLNYSFGYGDFNVALIETIGGSNSQYSKTISVYIKPQDVNLVNLPLNPIKNESIKFTFDANASPNIKTIGVDFGDSNTSYYEVTGLTPFDFNHAYTSGGNKTITLTASTTQDINKVFTFDVNLFGSIQLNFFSEDTNLAINPTVTFDGNVVTVTDGKVVINLSGMASKTYTVLASTETKTERRWDFDLNQFSSDLNVSLALLDTNKGTSVQFKFYAPDLTVLDNAWITGLINNRYSWRQKTDSSGYVTMFLNTNDANNSFQILSKADVNYLYYGTTVTVKKPLDEETNEVLSPFNLYVGGLAAQTYSALNADKTVQIFSDTVKTYEFNIDFNSDYYPRNYSVRTQGGATTYLIQPYLLKFVSSVFPAITIIDNVTGATIPDILIKVYANDLFLESRVTDSTGSAQMSFKITKTYKLYFYNSETDELYLTATLIPQSGDTEYTVKLNRTAIGGDYNATSLVYVNFYPSDFNLLVTGATATFYQDVNILNDVVTWVKITITKDGTVLYDNNFSTYITDSNTFTQTLNTAGWTENDLIYMKLSLGTATGAFNYYNNSAYSSWLIQIRGTGIFVLLSRVRDEELGLIGTTIISIIITLIVLGGFKSYFSVDNKAITIIGVGVLFIFTLIGWLPTIPVYGNIQAPILFIVLIPAAIIYLVRESRGI